DLILDGDGAPIVVVSRDLGSPEVYRRDAAGHWQHETVPVRGRFVATWSSTVGLVIVADGSALPVVAWKTQDVWTTSSFPGPRNGDAFSSVDEQPVAVAADAAGAIHVAHRQQGRYGRTLSYAVLSPDGSWTAPAYVSLSSRTSPTAIRILPGAGAPAI